MAEGSLTVAAMADLHVREGAHAPYRDLFAEIADKADVLVLAGDLTDHGKPQEARILADDIRQCRIPIMAVLGNHDYECGQVDEMKAILRDAGLRLLEDHSCEFEGVGFAGTKGFGGGFGARMLGSFGEPATKQFVQETIDEVMRLENALRSVRAARVMTVLHYAPVLDTIVGEPAEILPFLGCSRFGEAIDRFPVSAVVHGHAHVGRYEGRTPGGTPVYNVASMIEKPTGRPYGLITM